MRYFVCATGIPIGHRDILRIVAQTFSSDKLIGLYIILSGLNLFLIFLLFSVAFTQEIHYIFQLYSLISALQYIYIYIYF